MPPEEFKMKKGQFLVKTGQLPVKAEDIKMNLERRGGDAVLTIEVVFTPHQVAKDDTDETVIDTDKVPCGVFTFNDKHVYVNGFPNLVILGNGGDNTIRLAGNGFSILTDGKREHGETVADAVNTQTGGEYHP